MLNPDVLLEIQSLGVIHVDKGCLHKQPLVQTLGIEFLMSFPVWQHFTFSQNINIAGRGGGGIRHIPCDQILVVGFPWTYPCAFPLVDYILSFSYNNHSHKQDFMVSLASPASKSLNLGVVLRTPNMNSNRALLLSHDFLKFLNKNTNGF